jgi:uncharacterized membrane protein
MFITIIIVVAIVYICVFLLFYYLFHVSLRIGEYDVGSGAPNAIEY